MIKCIERELLQKNKKAYIQFREGLREGQGIKGWMDYKEVIDIVKQSNCILEVVQEGQNGITLRTMEAVCYGKKLLTNNKNIVKYPFYDSKYISVFEDIDDICKLIVFLSALFHDIGKPFSYQDDEVRHFHGHADVSSNMSVGILNRLGFNSEEVDELTYLIREHDTEITKEDIDIILYGTPADIINIRRI